MVTEDQVHAWVESYVRVWSTNSKKDIAALFSPQAAHHEWPYETDWISRDAITEGWQGRAPLAGGRLGLRVVPPHRHIPHVEQRDLIHGTFTGCSAPVGPVVRMR
ncbi:hypothetical protein ACFWOB_24555 [Streptomyces sp. NPDC058420]|uniref:hypothetical protein n=1 Tax=Streptomyces sp. NPDC058420 TaxID=3346489 RepID=UPI003646875C